MKKPFILTVFVGLALTINAQDPAVQKVRVIEGTRFYLSASFLYGIGLAQSEVVEYDSGEKVTLSGGGGFGFIGSIGYNFSKYFGLSADVSWQKAVEDDPVGEVEGEFTRWDIFLTPRLLIPVGDRSQLHLGAGAGLFFGGWLFLYSSGYDLPSVYYGPSFGYHFLGEYRFSITERFSVGLGIKYTGTTHLVESVSPDYYSVDDLTDEIQHLNGNSLDMFAGFQVNF
jgi:hypothetical protein